MSTLSFKPIYVGPCTQVEYNRHPFFIQPQLKRRSMIVKTGFYDSKQHVTLKISGSHRKLLKFTMPERHLQHLTLTEEGPLRYRGSISSRSDEVKTFFWVPPQRCSQRDLNDQMNFFSLYFTHDCVLNRTDPDIHCEIV